MNCHANATGWQAQLAWASNRIRAVVHREGVRPCLRRIAHRLARVLRGEATLWPSGVTERNVQYRAWRRSHEPEPGGFMNREADATHLTTHPLFVFAMPLANCHADLLNRIIESFRRQLYPHWELHVCGGPELPASARMLVEEGFRQDKRCTFVESTAHQNAHRLASEVLADSVGDFVGLIEDLIELAPGALLSLAERCHERPELELIYGDHDRINSDGERVDPFFKPGWSPDLFLSMNYLVPLCLIRRATLLQTGGWEQVVSDHGLYGLLLRFTDSARNVSHVPRVLCHALPRPASRGVSEQDNCQGRPVGVVAVSEALRRRQEDGLVTDLGSGRQRVTFQPSGDPLVSIVIPSRDRGELLKRCLETIERQTRDVRYEIGIVDNGTRDGSTLRYLDSLASRYRVIRSPGEFNFSTLNNEGAKQAAGDYLLFLNNDTEVTSPDWLSAMLGQAQRSGVGAVGAKLLYSNGRIQHAGVVLGVCGVAGHAFRHGRIEADECHGLSDSMRNCSAVTAACIMVPRAVFEIVRGFDEDLPVEFNDVDLCLRIHEAGYRVLYEPAAVLTHHENATRKGRRAPRDEERFRMKWSQVLAIGDPFYNPNLTRCREDWSLDV